MLDLPPRMSWVHPSYVQRIETDRPSEKTGRVRGIEAGRSAGRRQVLKLGSRLRGAGIEVGRSGGSFGSWKISRCLQELGSQSVLKLDD